MLATNSIYAGLHWVCRSFLATLVVAGIVGCKVGPNFSAPKSVVRASYNFGEHPRLQGAPAHLDHWWAHFNDPTLNALITQSLQQNLTLRQAGERITEARARRGVTAGNLYPQVQNINGSYAKLRTSANTANFFEFPGVFTPDLNPENYAIGAAASWELDFWGKYRRSVEAADGALNATIAGYHEARVLLLSEIAQAYVQMRTAEMRLRIAQQNLEIQQKTLSLADEKKAAGIGTGLDTAQAKINVGLTSAALPEFEKARLQASHALCVLLGRPPIDLSREIGFTAQVPVPPTNLCFGIPADLVRRRPDVRRAEFQLAAQSAQIGIAESDFYPHISLNGNIGYAAEDFGKLFGSRSEVALISPSFSWNLLNYGRIRNNVEAEKAAYRALCNEYHNSVLNAAREAEDAQVAFILAYDRMRALEFAVDGAKSAVEKSEQLYRAGTIDFGRVYVLQATLLEQQDLAAESQAEIALSLIQLFKAVGGGWNPSEVPVCTPPVRLVSLPVPPAGTAR